MSLVMLMLTVRGEQEQEEEEEDDEAKGTRRGPSVKGVWVTVVYLMM